MCEVSYSILGLFDVCSLWALGLWHVLIGMIGSAPAFFLIWWANRR